MTVGLWVIRWAGGLSKCALVVPWRREGWLEFVETPPAWDKKAAALAVFTDELPRAKVYATREAAEHDAQRLGLGLVVDLEQELQTVTADGIPRSSEWASVKPGVEVRR